MSTRWRMFGVLATTALVVTACSTGTGATSAPSAAAPSAAAPSTAASAAAPSAAAPSEANAAPVEFDWWHITTADCRQGRLPGHRGCLHGGASEREDQPHRPGERGVQDQARHLDAGRRRARPVPVLGRRHHGPAGRRRAAQGHHRGRLVLGQHDQPGRDEHLPVQRQAVRHPVGHGHDRLLVQQGAVRAGRHHGPARPPGTSTSPPSSKLKAAGITPLAIAGKDEWPSMHLWTYLVLRNGGGDALAQMVQTGDWNTDACIKAGEDVLALNALNPYQDGFKGATYNQRGCGRRQRQGGHGADGPVGARRSRTTTAPTRRAWATTSAGSPSRPSPAARAHPPTASVAATASPWARTRRRRRSTS